MLFSYLLASALTLSDPRAELLNLLAGEWVSQGIYVAAKLDGAHLLQKGPKTIRELSHLLQVKEEPLYRVLSMLANHGIFEEKEGKIFSNTPLSARIAHDHPETLHSLVVFYGEEIHQAFGSLLNSVETGKPAFDQIYHESVFDYFKSHPDRAALFQSAMAEKSKAVIQSAVDQIPLHGIVCDIGGGKGHLLYAALRANPSLKGIHFDLPEVIAALPQPPLAVQLQGGSFFESIPKADVYFMKSILHDWSDEKSVEILTKCRVAMPENAALYIIEPVLVQNQTRDYAKLTDVLMLAVTGGRERSLDEYKSLFEKCGFVITNIFSTPTEFRILEVKKKMTFKRFRVEKIIRDRLPEIMRNKGIAVSEKTLSAIEFIERLKDKLIEEANEAKCATDRLSFIEEIGDLLEVIEALCAAADVKMEDVREIMGQKRTSKGGFDRKIYNHFVEIEESNPAIEYYLKRPDQYPPMN